MINIFDLITDEADDIVIDGDLQIEQDTILSTVKTAERRVSARAYDFLLKNVGAGIEELMFKRITTTSKQLISGKIISSLTIGNLLTQDDFKVIILPEDLKGKLPIIIKFNFQDANTKYNFKTLINQNNQRSYN